MLQTYATPTSWMALATGLGLKLYAPTASYSPGMTFRQVKRTLGMPVSLDTKADFKYWLYGTWGPAEVVVLTYESGSSSSLQTWTSSLVRIDPNLFLGLKIRPESFLDRVFFPLNDIRLGHAEYDKQFWLEGLDHAGIRMLLNPQDPGGAGVLAALAACVNMHNTCVLVGDSIIEITRSGNESNPFTLKRDLDAAVYAATCISAERTRLPALPEQRSRCHEWQRFADDTRMTFDPARMRVRGTIADTLLEIALDSNEKSQFTAVKVIFPQAVNLAFTAVRTNVPNFLQGFLHNDIAVGDRVFDAMYVVNGHPAEAVRELLGRAPLLDVMKAVGGATQDVQLNPAGLHFCTQGAISSARDLHQIALIAHTLSATLLGEVKKMGVYR